MTIKEFMQKNNINTDGMKIYDGSGLSPLNLVSPYMMTDFLRLMYKEKDFAAFFNSLPVAGKTGSIRRSFQNTKAKGNLRAKSGYISGVRTYAGYFKDLKNEMFAFTIFVNNFDCSPYVMKNKIQDLLTFMIDNEY
jgi:D-alanyl-D-alanine carboxypeptidase/D-alanyl-D-alanine-endopeptidase (penicillin-binding protein 4)